MMLHVRTRAALFAGAVVVVASALGLLVVRRHRVWYAGDKEAVVEHAGRSSPPVRADVLDVYRRCETEAQAAGNPFLAMLSAFSSAMSRIGPSAVPALVDALGCREVSSTYIFEAVMEIDRCHRSREYAKMLVCDALSDAYRDDAAEHISHRLEPGGREVVLHLEGLAREGTTPAGQRRRARRLATRILGLMATAPNLPQAERAWAVATLGDLSCGEDQNPPPDQRESPED